MVLSTLLLFYLFLLMTHSHVAPAINYTFIDESITVTLLADHAIAVIAVVVVFKRNVIFKLFNFNEMLCCFL
jgi:hypothetical protein